MRRFGPLAQLVEQGTLNPKVEGSIPSRPISHGGNPVSPGVPPTTIWVESREGEGSRFSFELPVATA